MGYEDHPNFEQPKDPDAPIWRYLDFTKFVALLTTRSLYFSRVDRLGDAFEGSYPLANVALRSAIYRAAGLPEAAIADLGRQQENFARNFPRFVFVNCWTLSDWESVALWTLYSSMQRGVAIRSTLGRLKRALGGYQARAIHIGLVRYINYDGGDVFAEGNVLNPFLHKRRSFDFEHELRALIMDMTGATGANWSEGEGPPGIEVAIDLTQLVERVHVAPLAPTWFHALVRDVVGRLGSGLEVRQSAMTRGPVF